MHNGNSKHGWYVALGIVLSAAAYYLSTGLHGFWPLVWFAPIPILLVAFNSSPRTAAVAAFVAFFLGGLNVFTYLRLVVPPGVIVMALTVPGMIFALCVLASRWAVLRLGSWVSIFAFPAAWTTYEWLLSLRSSAGTWESLAYTQTDFLPLLQIVSITGIWGITFLLTLVPSGLAVGWHYLTRKQSSAPAFLVTLVLFLLTLGYGWVGLSHPVSGPSIRVGLATADAGVRYFRTEQVQEAMPVVQAYAQRAGKLAAQGAQVVVLPEKFVGVTPAYKDEVLNVLAEAARSNHVMLIAGLNLVGIHPMRNVAEVFAPDGQRVVEYDKVHFLPGPETGYKIGTKPGLFFVPGARCGVEICKDMDFPKWSRNYGRAGAGILFVPAWDFVVDGRWHARMAVVRGVEDGFALVRCAADGLMTVSDYQGRIIAEKPSSRSSEELLVSEVAPGAGHTFYSAAGNWFAWVSLILLILILGRTAFSRFGHGGSG
ncbi:MAG: nitrilase-related carbon-nitrogen hydrolase [Terriglobia bacterium]